MIMQYNILSQRVIETIEHLIKGYTLRLSIVNTEEHGTMLKVALMYWGGFEIAFFTNSNYLVILYCKLKYKENVYENCAY